MISNSHNKELVLPSPGAWGIDDKYRDDSGKWHDVGPETQSRFLEVMGANADAPPEAALIVVRQGGEIPVAEFTQLHLEDGTQLPGGDKLPADIPLGYHTHVDKAGNSSRLIVTPRKCFLPEDLRTWGWSLQLYALRSRASWGIGDLEDLRRICRWAKGTGAGVMMINPLCAAAPVLPQQASPYYSSSRLFLNPIYLRIEEIAGAREAISDLDALRNEGHALNEQPLIHRDAIYKLKMRALEAMWPRVRDQVNFEDDDSNRACSLQSFATFCVLAEQYGANWRAWPEEFRRPDNPAVSALNEKFGDRIKFHKWLQNILDKQLQTASAAGNVMQDLPVGVAPDGADAWMWQDVFAAGVNVGSPPDMFNVNGQNWGLPPFVPHKLREAGYEPFVQTLRAALRYARGLRIDHVMGLFRLFWIPQDQPSAQGTYVRYNADEMLSILALESQRAKTFIVGEDLGTVDEGVREKLAEYAVLSYRLLWFEEHPPEHYPKLAVAAVSTHDLPTIAGIWSGADFDEQNQLDLKPAKENSDKMREYLKRATNLDDGAKMSDVILKTHEALAKSPAVVTLASLEDGLGAEKRPNLPSAHSDQRPNWCIPLPKKLEEIENDQLVSQIAAHLKR